MESPVGSTRVKATLRRGRGLERGSGPHRPSLRLDGLCFSAGRLIIPTHSAELHVTSVP